LAGLKASAPNRGAAVAAVLLASLAAGCVRSPATLWADSALADGRFSSAPRQWVYDGEPVLFELQVAPGAANYVVFSVGDDAALVEAEEGRGHYRWTHVFQAGHEPQQYEVCATPFVVRERRDWIYDRHEEAWLFYPAADDRPDVQTATEQVMRITCYRREINLEFRARGGAPKAVTLTLVTSAGGEAVVPRRDPVRQGDRGFLLLGPDDRGMYQVTYGPAHDQVSRAGTTQVNLVVEHADGSVERIRDVLDTP